MPSKIAPIVRCSSIGPGPLVQILCSKAVLPRDVAGYVGRTFLADWMLNTDSWSDDKFLRATAVLHHPRTADLKVASKFAPKKDKARLNAIAAELDKLREGQGHAAQSSQSAVAAVAALEAECDALTEAYECDVDRCPLAGVSTVEISNGVTQDDLKYLAKFPRLTSITLSDHSSTELMKKPTDEKPGLRYFKLFPETITRFDASYFKPLLCDGAESVELVLGRMRGLRSLTLPQRMPNHLVVSLAPLKAIAGDSLTELIACYNTLTDEMILTDVCPLQKLRVLDLSDPEGHRLTARVCEYLRLLPDLDKLTLTRCKFLEGNEAIMHVGQITSGLTALTLGLASSSGYSRYNSQPAPVHETFTPGNALDLAPLGSKFFTGANEYGFANRTLMKLDLTWTSFSVGALLTFGQPGLFPHLKSLNLNGSITTGQKAADITAAACSLLFTHVDAAAEGEKVSSTLTARRAAKVHEAATKPKPKSSKTAVAVPGRKDSSDDAKADAANGHGGLNIGVDLSAVDFAAAVADGLPIVDPSHTGAFNEMATRVAEMTRRGVAGGPLSSASRSTATFRTKSMAAGVAPRRTDEDDMARVAVEKRTRDSDHSDPTLDVDHSWARIVGVPLPRLEAVKVRLEEGASDTFARLAVYHPKLQTVGAMPKVSDQTRGIMQSVGLRMI